MSQKPKSPPLTVVSGDARSAAMRLLAEKGLVATASRRPDRFAGDGMTGLGAGPPGTGEPPPAIHSPGGDLLSGLKHPLFVTVERLYRVLPEEAFFNPDLTPERPFKFDLGSFQAPKGRDFWLTDYSFGVLRLSGLDAGDFVYAETGRFSGQMCFDVSISGKRPSDLLYQLDPQPLSLTREQFRPPASFSPDVSPPDVFNAAAAASFASTAGVGSSGLPVRPEVQGPRNGPFSIVVDEGQYVTLTCVIFRALTAPIAAIEGRLAGFCLHTNLSRTLVQRMAPR